MADVIVKDAEGQPQTYRGIKRVILQTEGGEATFFDEIEAGEGIVIEGSTIKVDRNATPVYDDFGHYAGLVPMTTGDRVWGQALVSNDATPYAIAQRNASGGIEGIQNKLYVHEGIVSIDGTYNRYKIVNKKSTAITSPQTDFPERGNLFTLRTGPKVLQNLWYDSSDGTWYYTNSVSPDQESGSNSVAIVSDVVYEL